AMREKKMVGLARVVLTRREHVVMLEPFEKGLLATTLRYPYEIRGEADYFEDIPDLKLPAEMMKLAAHIVETKAGHFDPKGFEDTARKAGAGAAKDKAGGLPAGGGGGKAGAGGHKREGGPQGQHGGGGKEAGGARPRPPPPRREEENRHPLGLHKNWAQL